VPHWFFSMIDWTKTVQDIAAIVAVIFATVVA
jgi:hypothetical protein